MRISPKLLLLAALPLAIGGCGERAQPLTPDGVTPRRAITGLYIQGPNAIVRFADCSFRAIPSGGTAPYTYAWSVQNGYGTANGAIWTGHTWTTSMALTVTATDALGATRTATKNVAGIFGVSSCVTLD